MNHVRPLTNVSVSFVPVGDSQTRVILAHTAEWENARQWFVKAWKDTFEQLAKIVG